MSAQPGNGTPLRVLFALTDPAVLVSRDRTLGIEGDLGPFSSLRRIAELARYPRLRAGHTNEGMP